MVRKPKYASARSACAMSSNSTRRSTSLESSLTPGMIMSAVNLLTETPQPTEQQIREGISGNFCRCTGYQHIVNAIRHAANRR